MDNRKLCPLCLTPLEKEKTSALSVYRFMVDTLEAKEVVITAMGLAAAGAGADFLIRFLAALSGAAYRTQGILDVVSFLAVAWIGAASADRIFRVKQWWQPAVLAGVFSMMISSILSVVAGVSLLDSWPRALSAAVFLSGTTIGFTFLFRWTQPLIRFSWFRDIEEHVRVEGKKGWYDTAVCGECGERTVICALRPMALFYKRKYRYTCSSCGAFIRGNPIKNLAYGLFQVSIGWLFLSVSLVGKMAPTGVPANLLLAALVLLMTVDGLLRACSGLNGIVKLFRINSRDVKEETV